MPAAMKRKGFIKFEIIRFCLGIFWLFLSRTPGSISALLCCSQTTRVNFLMIKFDSRNECLNSLDYTRLIIFEGSCRVIKEHDVSAHIYAGSEMEQSTIMWDRTLKIRTTDETIVKLKAKGMSLIQKSHDLKKELIMKRILTIAYATALTAILLAGCGGQPEPTEQDVKNLQTQATADAARNTQGSPTEMPTVSGSRSSERR